MKSLELSELSTRLLQHLLQSLGEPIEVRVHGERLGTLSFESAVDESAIGLSRSARLQQILEKARADYKEHGGVSLEQVKTRLRKTQATLSVSD